MKEMEAKAQQSLNKSTKETGAYGEVTEPGTLRIERVLPGPIERVWAYLTEPEKRSKWFAGGPMELRDGGRLEFHFDHRNLSPHDDPAPERYKHAEGPQTSVGRVTRCEPPNLISFTWGDELGDSEVTFELTPQNEKVLMVLTHRRLADRSMTVMVAAGWHAHVALLIDNLNQEDPRPFWSTFSSLEAEYEKRIPQ
jgi:uncharacterized protein YndB with AHSA1/START domain